MAYTQKRLPTDSWAGVINEARAASTAGGGTALSTTAAIVGLCNGTTHVGVVARNFTTAVVMKFAVNPYLLILKTANSLGSVTDYSSAGQQNPATAGAISLSSFGTKAAGHATYVGSHVPRRGAAIVMSANVNDVASVLSLEYWNGSAWVAVSNLTDGTANAGATFAQSGNITYTVPTDWVATNLPATLGVVGMDQQSRLPYSERPRYWIRKTVSATLKANTAANSMFALNRSTAYAEAVQDSLLQFRCVKGVDGAGCLELLTDAGTANAIVNCYIDSALGAF